MGREARAHHMSTDNRRLFVATPMFGGQCSGWFTSAIVELTKACVERGLPFDFTSCFNEARITRARNILVDEFLRSTATHLMFVDSDVDFAAADVLALLDFDRPIIGGAYPKKAIAWHNVRAAALNRIGQSDPAQLQAFSTFWNANVLPDSEPLSSTTPVQVAELATGFLMIRRDVFDRFRATYPERRYRSDNGPGPPSETR